jgi:hypothetical protein
MIDQAYIKPDGHKQILITGVRELQQQITELAARVELLEKKETNMSLFGVTFESDG